MRVAWRAGWVVTHPSWDVLMPAGAGHIGGLGWVGVFGAQRLFRARPFGRKVDLLRPELLVQSVNTLCV